MTYYLPQGYGTIYYTSPFTLRSRLVGGVQKFFAGDNGYPYALWASICPSPCPFTQSMYGWEITKINDLLVVDFIKNFSRGYGTYYDDGVRANGVFSFFGQTSLTSRNMPDDATFSPTFVNPSDGTTVTITIPFGFGANTAGWSTNTMVSRNFASARRSSGELYAETDLLEALTIRVSELRKRSDSSSSVALTRASDALRELSAIVQRNTQNLDARNAILRRDGRNAYLDEGNLPDIPSPRERMEDVIRLSQALWPLQNNNIAEFATSEASLANEIATSHPTTSTRKSAASATEKPIIAGDLSQWTLRSSISASNLETYSYYGNYRTTSVVRLRRFAHTTSGTADTTFSQALNAAIQGRTVNNMGENLIIDVTNNGGGLICLNYHSLSFLVKTWADRDSYLYGNDIVFSEYDMRLSELSALQLSAGTYSFAGYHNSSNGASLGLSHMLRPSTRTIGSKTSNYTQGYNWNPCRNTQYSLTPPAYNFDKIIVMTDGRCGSSCAYFVSQLRENNKVRVVSYGGIYGEPLATSSFAGGNVYTWEGDVRYWNPSLPQNPFNSYVAYNLRQNYSPGKFPGTPRQMERLEADWYLPHWDSFYLYTNNVNTTARIDLYESILPLFDEMPAGLARTEAGPIPPNAPPFVPIALTPPSPPPTTPTSPPSIPASPLEPQSTEPSSEPSTIISPTASPDATPSSPSTPLSPSSPPALDVSPEDPVPTGTASVLRLSFAAVVSVALIMLGVF